VPELNAVERREVEHLCASAKARLAESEDEQGHVNTAQAGELAKWVLRSFYEDRVVHLEVEAVEAESLKIVEVCCTGSEGLLDAESFLAYYEEVAVATLRHAKHVELLEKRKLEAMRLRKQMERMRVKGRPDKYGRLQALAQPDWNPNKVRASHKVVGAMKQNTFAAEKRRVNVKADNKADTTEGVMDERTRHMIFRWVQAGVMDEVHGCLSTGKEANVYHGTAGSAAEENDGYACPEFALKVFRTTLSEFSNRTDYVEGDYRYRHRKLKSNNPRQYIKTWAEKERNNLLRMRHVGLRVPLPLQLREHILRMEFIGSEGVAAPKLKVALPGASNVRRVALYGECCAMVRTMWQHGKLVHGDLSEYNILVHEKHPWFIDVAQAVEVNHRCSEELLRRDIFNLNTAFRRHGVLCASVPATMAWVLQTECAEGCSLRAGDAVLEAALMEKAGGRGTGYEKAPMRDVDTGEEEEVDVEADREAVAILNHMWDAREHIVEEWVTKAGQLIVADEEGDEGDESTEEDEEEIRVF